MLSRTRRGRPSRYLGIEVLWHAGMPQRIVQRIKTKLDLHDVRQPPEEHLAAPPIIDRHEVHEPLGPWDVGDVSAPGLVGALGREAVQQIRIGLSAPEREYWFVAADKSASSLLNQSAGTPASCSHDDLGLIDARSSVDRQKIFCPGTGGRSPSSTLGFGCSRRGDGGRS